MVREIITIQVGQCGNQIGRQFWGQALEEHAVNNPDGIFDDCMSTFFRNVDTRYDQNIPIGDGRQPIYNLKARAVLVDMDSAPVLQTQKGELGDLFDPRHFVTDVSGAGNNWAHGNSLYGPKYAEELLEAVRRNAEDCDSLQSFFFLHSMGGGTGSGLGTYLLDLLENHYPDVYRFTSAVFPSEDDDVITSPYNTVLALKELTEHADCVLPVDNASLAKLVTRSAAVGEARDSSRGRAEESHRSRGSGFDSMNGLVARLLTDLTASMRFAGELNVDLNEITTNLVPYPGLHYILSSLSPLPVLEKPPSRGEDQWRSEIKTPSKHGCRQKTRSRDEGRIPALRNRPQHVAQLFSDSFSNSHQLMQANPRMSIFLACGFLMRGNVMVSDINTNIMRMSNELKMVHWNQEGFKIGLCGVPPVGEQQSLLSLSNNCCIRYTFEHLRERFVQLYSRRAMLHHYTQFVEQEVFDEALLSVDGLIANYTELDREDSGSSVPRLQPVF
ncbi:unnamed protein product [Choristocarpus tenellus]